MANPSAPVNPSTVQSPTGYAPSLGQVPLYDPNAYMQGLVSNMEDSMRMDNLAQQIALNRQMQGYGAGSGIYDYLQNVYGDILGVNFQNPDYGQFLQQNQGTSGSYTPGSVSMFSDYHNPYALNNLTPEQKAEYIPQNTAYLGNGYNAGAQMDPGLKGTMTNGSYINGGLGGPPSQEWIADQIAKHAGYSQDYKGPMDTTTPRAGFGLPAGNQAQGNQPGNTLNVQPVQAPWNGPPAVKGGQYQAGTGPTALGKSMPKGTYTESGTSFNPNMNSTWAKFLAPTYGKISQLSDSQLKAIQRQMPRGGEQDRAVSDAIAQKYGTMMGGWQSLVPQALQGLHQIGQEQYFQQPSYTGGLGTAAGMRSGDQNAALQEQQMQLSNSQFDKQLAQQKAQNKGGLFSMLGNAIGGGLSNLLTGGLSSLLSGGGGGGGNSGGSTDYGIKTPLGSKPFGM